MDEYKALTYKLGVVAKVGGLALGDRGWGFWLVVLGVLGFGGVGLIVLATFALFFLRLHLFPNVP